MPLPLRRLLLPLLLLLAVSGTLRATDADPRVVVRTSLGAFTVELYARQAPATVANFLAYAEAGFYGGTIFHRVIDGFVAQGGGFTPTYERKPTRDPIQNEADNGLRNETMTLAMARTGNPHSATSQFFVNLVDNDFLDHRDKGAGWGYAVFGRVVAGEEVVRAIAAVPTGAAGPFRKDAPLEPVVIQSVELLSGS